MTDETAPQTTQTEPPADPPAQPDPTPDPTPDPRNAEAAKWRRALREAEAKIARQDSRLEAIDRQEVEKIAAEQFSEPTDIWLLSSLDQMRDEDGALDPERVTAELARVVSERPHWKIATTGFDGGTRTPPPSTEGFGERLKRAVT